MVVFNFPLKKPTGAFWLAKGPKGTQSDTYVERTFEYCRNIIRETLKDDTIGEGIKLEKEFAEGFIPTAGFEGLHNFSDASRTRTDTKRKYCHEQYGTFIHENKCAGQSVMLTMKEATAITIEKSKDNPEKLEKKERGGEVHKESLPLVSIFFSATVDTCTDDFFKDAEIWRIAIIPYRRKVWMDIYTIRYLQNCYVTFANSEWIDTCEMISLTPMCDSVTALWEHIRVRAKITDETHTVTEKDKKEFEPISDKADMRYDADLQGYGATDPAMPPAEHTEDDELVEIPVYGEEGGKRQVSKRLLNKLTVAAKQPKQSDAFAFTNDEDVSEKKSE